MHLQIFFLSIFIEKKREIKNNSNLYGSGSESALKSRLALVLDGNSEIDAHVLQLNQYSDMLFKASI